MNNLLAHITALPLFMRGSALMSISPNALSSSATLMGSLAKTLDVKTRDGIALAVTGVTTAWPHTASSQAT